MASQFQPRDWFYTPVEREYTQRVFRQTLTPPVPPLPGIFRSVAVVGGSAIFSRGTDAITLAAGDSLTPALATLLADVVTLKTQSARVDLSYEVSGNSGVLMVGSTVVLDGLSVRLDEGSVSLRVTTGVFAVSAPLTANLTVSVGVINRQPAEFGFTYIEGNPGNNNAIDVANGDFEFIGGGDDSDDLNFECVTGRTAVATTIEGIAVGGNCVPELISPISRLKLDIASVLTRGAGTRASPWEVPRTNLNANGIILADAAGRDGGASTYQFSGGNTDLSVDADDGEIRFARDVSATLTDARYTVTVTVAVTVNGLVFEETREVVFFVPAAPALPPITYQVNFGDGVITGGSGTQTDPYLYPLTVIPRADPLNDRTTFSATLVVSGGNGSYSFVGLRDSNLRLLGTALSGQGAGERSLFLDGQSSNRNVQSIVVDRTYNQEIQIRSGGSAGVVATFILYVRTVAPATTPPDPPTPTPTPLAVNVQFDGGGAGSDADPYAIGVPGAVGDVLATVNGVAGTPAASAPLYTYSETGGNGVLEVTADGRILIETALPVSGKQTITVAVRDSATPAGQATTVVVFDVTIPLRSEVDFDGTGVGSDADPYVFGGAAGTSGDVGVRLATVTGAGGTPAASAPLYSYSETGGNGVLEVTADGEIRIETALASSGKQTITVAVSDSASPAGQTSTVVVFDVNVALRSEVGFLVPAFDPDDPANAAPAAGAGTAGDPFVFEGTAANIAAHLASVSTQGGTHRTVADATDRIYLREKVGTEGSLMVGPDGNIGFIATEQPNITASGMHTITVKITDGSATPKVNTVTVFVSVHIRALLTRAEPSAAYYTLDELGAAGDLIFSQIRTQGDVEPASGVFSSCVGSQLFCGFGNLDNAAVTFSKVGTTYQFSRKALADINDLTRLTGASFNVVMGGEVTLPSESDGTILNVTLEFVDAAVTPMVLTLTGAVAPPSPVQIGAFLSDPTSADGRPDINIVVSNSDVERRSGGGLFYSGDLAANLETAVADIVINRGEAPGAALRSITLPVPLQGCYRQFNKVLIPPNTGTSGVTGIAAAGTHMLFLHRNSFNGDDNVYLPFLETDDDDNVVFNGGLNSAAEEVRVTLAAGDVLSVVPNAEGEAGASNAANFRRIYGDDGEDDDRATPALRIAVEEAVPTCGTADLDGIDDFYLSADWTDLKVSRLSRFTFPEPVTDGTVLAPGMLSISSNLDGDGTLTDPFVYATRSAATPARFTLDGITDPSLTYGVETTHRATGMPTFAPVTGTSFDAISAVCRDPGAPCAIQAFPTNVSPGAYLVVVNITRSGTPIRSVSVYFSVSEDPETPVATSDVSGRGTHSDPFQFAAGTALKLFTLIEPVSSNTNVDGVAFRAPGEAAFATAATNLFSRINRGCTNNFHELCTIQSRASLPVGAYKITVIIQGDEDTLHTVYAVVAPAAVGDADDHLSASLSGTPLTNAGTLNDPYTVPLGAINSFVLEFFNSGDFDTRSPFLNLILEGVQHRVTDADPFTDRGAVTGGGGVLEFRFASNCFDDASAGTNCTITYSNPDGAAEGVYLITFLITDTDGVATRVQVYVEAVNEVVTVEDDVTDHVDATLPDPTGGNNATVPLPYPGDGTAANPYELTDTSSRRTRFAFLDSGAARNVAAVTPPPFDIENIQYRATDDGAFVDEALVPVAADSQNRPVFVLDGNCRDVAAANTNCRIAQNPGQDLKLGGVYRIIAAFTASSVRTRVTIHLSVSDEPRGPGGYLIADQIDPAGGTDRFALPGSGTFSNPYRIPQNTAGGVRFTMLNTERHNNTEISVDRVEICTSSTSCTNRPELSDGRLDFVLVNGSTALPGVCADDLGGAGTNCQMALNGGAAGRSARQLNAIYRVTFITVDNNSVVTRVHFYAIIGNEVESTGSGLTGNGTSASPFQFTRGNSRSPDIRILANGITRGLSRGGNLRLSYRREGSSGFGTGGTAIAHDQTARIPFFVSGSTGSCPARDCLITGRTGSNPGEIQTLDTGLYLFRLEIRRGGSTGFLFYYFSLN